MTPFLVFMTYASGAYAFFISAEILIYVLVFSSLSNSLLLEVLYLKGSPLSSLARLCAFCIAYAANGVA